jgi:hypothetical protein
VGRRCSCLAGCVYCETDYQPIPPDRWLLARPSGSAFGAELERAIARRGLTQGELAAIARVSA